MKLSEVKRWYHKGKANSYAWPGGYPLFYLCSDSGTLCPECVTKNRSQVFRSTHERSHDGWAVEAIDVNWESEMYCDNCSKEIESAYGPVTES